MRFGLMLASIAMAACAASVAVAAEPATAPAPKPVVKQVKDQDRIVCKAEDQIGTRLGGTRTCHTVAEWAQMQREASTTTSHIQIHGKSGPVDNGG